MGRSSAIVVPVLSIAWLLSCEWRAAQVEHSPEHPAGPMGAASKGDTASAALHSTVADCAAAAVSALPLRHGYYVDSDTPCSKASNATVSLLGRDGIAGARDFCTFEKIEQTGLRTYRVTQSCKVFRDTSPPEVSVVIYTFVDESRFTSRRERGWAYSARYCSQSSMPPQWRQNDIRDAGG